MKKLAIILFFSGLSLGMRAQLAVSNDKPVAKEAISLKETTFDFGKIQQSHPVTHEFEIVNVSQDTLKLLNVQASCGCTTPVWKKDPVAPGASTIINVGYNAAAQGTFEKTITILYNAGLTKTITIKGEVYKTPVTAVPQNTSIQLLKKTNQ
ncbi:MAG: DUF1573 domain-containing protein [Chitinophagaceae bacterium]